MEKLRRENARLQRLVETLMDRVEKTTNSANSPFGFFQVHSALSEQASQQQAQLRDNEKTLQILFERAPVGMLVLDPEMRVCRANERAEVMLGVSAPAMIGQRMGQIIRCQNAADHEGQCGTTPQCPECPLYDLFKRTRESGRGQMEHEFSIPTGHNGEARRVWFSLTTEAPVFKGRKHLLILLEDLSAKKQAERDIQRARQMAEEGRGVQPQFLSDVKGMIQRPITGMMSQSAAILESPDLETARGHAGEILQESARLLAWIDRQPDLSGTKSGERASSAQK